MKIDRLFSITNMLIDKKTVTAAELADYFNVSIRTIYRDIDILSANGIPIFTSQGKGGGISIVDSYSIDKTLLSDDEQKQVLMALQSVKATGQLEVNEAISKLGGLFQKKNTNWIEIDFSNWQQSDKDKEIFSIIKDSIFNSKAVSFSYFNNKGEKSYRIVEPLKLVFKGQSWYLYGYCRKRDDFRFFKLRRIEELISLEDTIEVKEPSNIPKDYEINNNYEVKNVKLKIDSTMAFRVYDEFQKGKIEFKDNYFIVEVTLQNNDWLYSYLLSFGNKLEVLEPMDIREDFKKLVKGILNNYL